MLMVSYVSLNRSYNIASKDSLVYVYKKCHALFCYIGEQLYACPRVKFVIYVVACPPEY